MTDIPSTIKRALDMVPDGFLRPAIQNRAAYIHLIQKYNPKSILDIGTGSIAIYLLILQLYYPNIRTFGTENNQQSYNNALMIVKEFNLNSFIEHSSIIPMKWLNEIDFIICNPPFYKSESDILHSKSIKQDIPKLAFQGKPHELITQGGEVEFIKSIINQSLHSRSLQYCSAMFGFKSSLILIKKYLKFIQSMFGLHLTIHQHSIYYTRTARWVLVWKFCLKGPFTLYYQLSKQQLEDVSALMLDHGEELDKDGSTTTCLLSKNTWSRQFTRHPNYTLKSRFKSVLTIQAVYYNNNDLFMITGDGLGKSFWMFIVFKLQIIECQDTISRRE